MKEKIRSLEEASRWAPDCLEYFEAYQDGIFDDFNQIQVILPLEELHADTEKGELILGYAGVDGIFFCLLEGKSGVWAYYGIDDEYVKIAPSLSEFVSRWTKREVVL